LADVIGITNLCFVDNWVSTDQGGGKRRALCVLDPRQCLLIEFYLRLADLDLQGGEDVEFKGNGPGYRYNDASIDRLNLLSSRLCECR